MHQPPLFHAQARDTFRFWAHICATCCLGVLFLYVLGLLPFVAYGLQRWAAASRWDWQDRWASVRAFAVCGGVFFALIGSLLVVPVPLFRVMLHVLQAHLPLLGAFTLIPLRIANMPARWLFLLPLAPVLTLLFERVSPRTTGVLTRVLLPHEVEQLRRQRQEAAAHATQEQARVLAAQTPKPKRPRRAPAKRKHVISIGVQGQQAAPSSEASHLSTAALTPEQHPPEEQAPSHVIPTNVLD